MEKVQENGGVHFIVKKSDPVLVRASKETDGGYYFLSNLDQNIAVIMKTVQCFKANNERKSRDNVCRVMKEALEKVLVYYYPLTGSLEVSNEGKLVVRCDGRGVVFVEAVAECELEELGDFSVRPDCVKLGKLVHTTPEAKNILEKPLMTAQVTIFKCGGFTLGTAINHCMVDGFSAVEFLTSWSETARNVPLTSPPFLDRSLLRSRHPPSIHFPHPEFLNIPDVSNTSSLYRHQPLVYRSFTFDHAKLARLKKPADNSSATVSSFAALSAFVWRARTIALKMGPTQQTKLLFAVNVRTRLEPALPAGYFGNGTVLACCLCEAGELLGEPLGFAVGLVQKAVEGTTDGFARSAIDYFEVTRARPSLDATLLLSTWTRLGFGGLDFGWGEAVQTGPVALPQKEVALFLPKGKGSKSVVLLLGLPVSSMETFEKLVELI